jgi:hypothetical protein
LFGVRHGKRRLRFDLSLRSRDQSRPIDAGPLNEIVLGRAEAMRRIFSQGVSREPGDVDTFNVQPHFCSIVPTLRMRLVAMLGADVGVLLTRFGWYMKTRFRKTQDRSDKALNPSVMHCKSTKNLSETGNVG